MNYYLNHLNLKSCSKLILLLMLILSFGLGVFLSLIDDYLVNLDKSDKIKLNKVWKYILGFFQKTK